MREVGSAHESDIGKWNGGSHRSQFRVDYLNCRTEVIAGVQNLRVLVYDESQRLLTGGNRGIESRIYVESLQFSSTRIAYIEHRVALDGRYWILPSRVSGGYCLVFEIHGSKGVS